ncbi:MAG: GNAT family N-acetyltransferase [Alphaproteobacteria bacterium]|nr:GNAT family N-acetyltransferase [Alphaproteobacteria bacterium]
MKAQGPRARLVDRIADVSAADWDLLANPSGEEFNPFITHAFLKALEDSDSVGTEAGWRPAHALLEDGKNIVAAAPMYVKSHSYGEYVFDHHWADAFHRAGGRYYPKLQVAVPFTPATGRRLLVGQNKDARIPLATALMQFAERLRLSSLHITFAEREEYNALARLGFLQRTDQQFHWQNEGYATFVDFLGALSSIKRKNLRRERAEALSADITVEWITGSDIKERHWDAFFDFYIETGSRKWGSPYLTREFFSLVGAAMPDRILLVMAKRNGRYIAGALNFIGSHALYGRNWGAIEHHRFLHFELCYYQAIDYAIAHKLPRVEAGAQGAHKLARGYMPVETHSLHWIAHAGLRSAVERYLREERRAVAEEIEALSEHGPFRNEGTD